MTTGSSKAVARYTGVWSRMGSARVESRDRNVGSRGLRALPDNSGALACGARMLGSIQARNGGTITATKRWHLRLPQMPGEREEMPGEREGAHAFKLAWKAAAFLGIDTTITTRTTSIVGRRLSARCDCQPRPKLGMRLPRAAGGSGHEQHYNQGLQDGGPHKYSVRKTTDAPAPARRPVIHKRGLPEFLEVT